MGFRDAATGLSRRVIVLHKEDKPLGAIARVLRRDYRVDEFDDSDVAARSASIGHVRAVFVDMDLAVHSGLRLLRQLPRKQYGRPPILLVGRAGDPRVSLARTQEMADTILEWPCPAGKLLGQVWRLLDKGIESYWLELPQIQQEILFQTRKMLAGTVKKATRGEEVLWETIAASSESMVQAVDSGDMAALLQSLKISNQLQFVHAIQVATNMTVFGQALGFSHGDLQTLAQAGLMHDLGMNVLPQELTNKPDSLSLNERDRIRRHPLITAKLLQPIADIPPEILDVAMNHHEQLDGGGYPHGKKGMEIDNISLICAMADAHAALTSRRPHRAALKPDDAFEMMWQQAGKRFDHAYLHRFEEVMRDLGG